jgi:hypothetical protein
LPASASATFHLVYIREVYPGSAAAPDAEYVELQAYAPGQNFVGGHQVKTYDTVGAIAGTTAFPTDLPNGETQSTYLLATPAAEAFFGIDADATMSPNQIDPAGGAVCWETLDCVSWGSFGGSLPSPAGSPAVPGGVPDGMALRRTITPGCATALEQGDDRDDSATDFSVVFPAPRPNAVKPTERVCPGSEGSEGGFFAGGGGGGAMSAGPKAKLTHAPPHLTTDRTPTFRFVAGERHVIFQCKLDRHRFRACRSPFTTRRLATGHHMFQVRAQDRSDGLAGSPVRWAFRIVARP